jgi:DNA-binding transcriptional LysR family regulator
MELMQLEMFVAVVEERSFLRAAERVFRTQPAVSIGLRKLEGRIGVPLLDRSSRRTGRLTPAGERLYEYARRILELRDEALSALREKEKPWEGTLCVGLVGEESINRFPLLWKHFKQRFPTVEVKIHSDSLNAVLGELANRHVEVALVSGRPRCFPGSKDLVVARIRASSGYGWTWIVRPRLGKSSLAHAFERSVLENIPTRTETSKPKGIGLRQLRGVR